MEKTLWHPVAPARDAVHAPLAAAGFEMPDARRQAFQRTRFTQNPPVLESQPPKGLPRYPRAELHSAADRMSSAYRRRRPSCGVSFGVC